MQAFWNDVRIYNRLFTGNTQIAQVISLCLAIPRQKSNSTLSFTVRMHLFYRAFSTISLCLLFILNPLFGQQKQSEHGDPAGYDIRHFTDENGLPQNSVKAIARDLRGNIWLGTERGLVRFDGTHFMKFDDFGNSFSARSIYSFNLDPQSRTGDLMARASNDTWIRIKDGKTAIDTAFRRDGPYTAPNLSKARDRHLVESLPDLNEAALADYHDRIISTYPASGGRYFAYGQQSVGYYVNNKLVKYFPFPGKSFFRFFRVDENLYYLDEKFKLTFFPGGAKGQRPLEVALAGPVLSDIDYRSTGQYHIYWNNCSNQVFISTGRRLYHLQTLKDGSLVSKLILDGFDFNDKGIKAILLDTVTGRLFLGSQVQGLYVVSKRQFRAVTDPSVGADNVYYGQVLLGNKAIASTTGATFALDSSRLGKLSSHLSLIKESADFDKYSIIKDLAGTIWCKRRENLFRFDASGKRIISSWKMADEIKQLYQGQNGWIWIGTDSDGLYYIDPSAPGTQPRFFAGRDWASISWIQHQTRDILWVGTGKGLYKIHLPSKKIFQVNKLADIYIRSLYIPDDGNQIWITTYTSGLFLIKDGKLTQFPLDKKQYLSGPHCIVEDRNGFFWMTTNKGLFQVRKADLLAYADKPFELYYHYYSKIDGFNTNEFNGGCQPCGLRTPEGIVSFPSFNGLVWFVPERIRPELPTQQIFMDYGGGEDSMFVFERGKISVKAGVPQIVVNVTTPYFGDPYNLRMSYQIFKGSQPITEWRALEESRSIAIPFQGGGNYMLHVRKINGFGKGNQSEMHFSISVEKKWHETWWFRGVLATAVLLLFYGILRQRVRIVKRQNQALEIKVRERTEHLEKTLSVLSDSEKQLEQQVRLHIHMIASISHDIRTPVKHMAYALDYSQALIEENKPDSAIAFIKQLKLAVGNMYHMVDNLVNFIKPGVRGVSSTVIPVNLHELISEKVLLFKQIAEASNAVIEVNVNTEEIVLADSKLLGIIIHNLIDNAIKVRHGNTLRIYLRHQEANLHLIFEDNGPGMPAELMNWLNQADHIDNSSLPAGYEGLGLLLLKQISKLLRIELYVANNPGATIQLVLRNARR